MSSYLPPSTYLMLWCPECKTNQSAIHFDRSFKTRRGYSSYCRVCVRTLHRKRYQENKHGYNTRVLACQKVRHVEKRGFEMVADVQRRAASKNLGFDLDPADIHARVAAGKCEVTGIAFRLEGPMGWDIPSLDRIDSSRGYTKDNVRVVLWAVNAMCGTWGLDKAVEIAKAIIANCQSSMVVPGVA